MGTRRMFLSAVGGLVAGSAAARADDVCAVFTKSAQSATTPDDALSRLKAGNARFLAGKPIHCNLMALVKGTAAGQAPFAAVLGCMDSRVSPELVFDQRIGDIFVVRIAGNFVNADILGSLEYATQVVGAKAIVVVGHSDCGAVKGAIDGVALGHLTGALENIRPAIARVGAVAGPHNSKNKKFVQAVADQNAKDAATALAARSDILAARVARGELKIVSAMHHVDTGEMTWFG